MKIFLTLLLLPLALPLYGQVKVGHNGKLILGTNSIPPSVEPLTQNYIYSYNRRAVWYRSEHTLDWNVAWQLDVNRPNMYAMSMTLNGVFKFGVLGNGGVYGLAYNVLSDARLKHHVRPLQGCLGTLCALEAKQYQYRPDTLDVNGQRILQSADSSLHLGFIAQEVEQVLPSIVSTLPTGYKAINYVELIPMLVEALKESHAEVQALQAQVDSLASQYMSWAAGFTQRLDGCCKVLPSYKTGDSGIPKQSELPLGYFLGSAMPNPTSGQVVVPYQVPSNVSGAEIRIFNLVGQHILAQTCTVLGEPAKLALDLSGMSEGLYVYALVAGGQVLATGHVLLTR